MSQHFEILARHGFSIRMSNPDSANHRTPSLISPSSLLIKRLGSVIDE